MADLGKDNKLPPTSPPFVPEPPTRPVRSNTPDGRAVSVTPHLTEEEIAAAEEAERLALEQDMVEALAEEEASNAAMAALEGAFVPNGIFRHRGVGPIKYETKRGLVSMFSGDLACHVIGPVQPVPDPPPAPEDLVTDDDWIIVSEAVLSALLFTVDYKMFPDTLEYRVARITEARRAAAAAPPADAPTGESFQAKKSPVAREKELTAAQKVVAGKKEEPPKTAVKLDSER